MKDRARSFRKNMTDAENRMWYFLRDRRLNGYKFVREIPFDSYIADFVCRAKKVIVEIDGAQHAEEQAIKYDKKRTEFLEKNGYKIIRFWNSEVFGDINVVLEAILAFLKNKN